MDVETVGVHESVNDVFPADQLINELSSATLHVELVRSTSTLSSCDVLVTLEYDPAFTELRWIHSIQAGVDRFPLEDFERRGVILTNSTGIHGNYVGETVAGYVLSFARRLHQAARNQTRRRWERPNWDQGFTVAGKSACVVGLGTLGRGIADSLLGLNVEVSGVKRSVEPVPNVSRVYPPDQLGEAIEDAKFVALALPLTNETAGLIGQTELEAMRDDAYLINVSRGPIVDTDELISALRADVINGAALDVFEQEPLPSDSPLWDFEEVIITPHIAGVARSYYVQVADLVRDNVDRLASGSDLKNRVT